MRDHLNGFAQIVAAALFFQHGGVDAARADRIRVAGGHAGEAFIVAKVQIGLGAIVGHENLAVLKRAHRAGVDVQIRVKLAQTDRVAARLQQRPQCGRGQTLAQG